MSPAGKLACGRAAFWEGSSSPWRPLVPPALGCFFSALVRVSDGQGFSCVFCSVESQACVVWGSFLTSLCVCVWADLTCVSLRPWGSCVVPMVTNADLGLSLGSALPLSAPEPISRAAGAGDGAGLCAGSWPGCGHGVGSLGVRPWLQRGQMPGEGGVSWPRGGPQVAAASGEQFGSHTGRGPRVGMPATG